MPYYYLNDDTTVKDGDELFVTTNIRPITQETSIACGEWQPVHVLWYGWTIRYFERRLSEMGMPGKIFIRRKF